jgi:DNA-binding transcriptional regulator YiaG
MAWSPSQVRDARMELGLSIEGLADALKMGANGGTRVREWERGEREITGPAQTAIELMLEGNRYD